MKRIIPKNKIANQRMGQLIFNAMERVGYWKYVLDKGTGRSEIIQEKDIFYIENDELEKVIQKFLKEIYSPPKKNAKAGK